MYDGKVMDNFASIYSDLKKELIEIEKNAKVKINVINNLFALLKPLKNRLVFLLKEIEKPLSEDPGNNEVLNLKKWSSDLLKEIEDIFEIKQDEDIPEYPIDYFDRRISEYEQKEKQLAEKIHRDFVYSKPKPQPGTGWEKSKPYTPSDSKSPW